MKKRLFAALVSLCLIVSMLPTMAFAEAGVQDSGTTIGASGLCEHHTEHTADCGYTEGTAEIPCSHEHTEDCYTLVTECVHEHTAECYPAESVSENTATPSEPGEAEPTACTHECSEESGCITKTSDCKHEHDETCGYVPATAGTPCTFVCEVCNAQDSGNPATPSDAQPEECTCETLCTGEEINTDCPVCSAEGAELDKVCIGVAPMLPVTALAAGEDAPATLYVGETDITTGGYWKTTAEGKLESGSESDYNVHYDGNGTLTLNNATIHGRGDVIQADPQDYGIYAAPTNNQSVSLTINLIGSNTVSGHEGIRVNAPAGGNATLVIQSDGNDSKGSLEAIGSGWNGIKVSAQSGNASLTINHASVEASTEGQFYYGVSIMNETASNPILSLTVNGGSLTAQGASGIRYYSGAGTNPSTSLTVSDSALIKAVPSISASVASKPTPTVSGASGGIVFDGKNGTVYGDVELQEKLEIGKDETLTIPDGSSLDSNGKLTNEGTIINNGTLTGDVGGNGTVTPKITTGSLPNGTVGEPYTATLEATGNNITWSSSDKPEWMTLDTSTGVISGTPTAEGTSTFTVTATNSAGSNSKEYTLNIKSATVPVTSVTLNKDELSLYTGKSETLIATVQPDSATNKNVTWSSDNDNVATVDTNGKVTAVSAGKATITVTTEDGKKTAICTVTVTQSAYSISADPTALSFDSKTEGYTEAPAAQEVTITNTGNQTVTVTLPTSTNYSITAGTGFANDTATLAPNGTAQFTVQPIIGLGVGNHSETLTISGSNNTSASVTLAFQVDPKQYLVTVSGSYAQITGAGSYAKDATVTIDAGTRSGYTFDGWTSADGVKFANADSEKTTFTMPDKAVTVTANWTKKSSGGGGGSSYDYYTITASAGTGGSISPSGNISVREDTDKTFTITPDSGYHISDVLVDGKSVGAVTSYTFENVQKKHTIEAVFAKDNPTTPTTAKTKTVKTDSKGNVIITRSLVSDAISAAQTDAKKHGNQENGIAVEVPVEIDKKLDGVQITLKADALDTLVKENVKRFTIDTDRMTDFGFTLDTLKELNRQTSGDIILKVKKTAVTSVEAKAAIGTRPVYDISLWEVKNGKETRLTDLYGKTISIAIPYTPAKNEQPGNLYAIYVDGNGKPQWITQSSYDADQKAVIFELTQSGIYGVGYDAKTPAFTDITGHWAKDNILFVVSRGLLNGTSKTTFSPNNGMTRGMFVTALGRLAGVDPADYQSGKFTDVKADAYYAPYVNWAASKGIVSGTTDTTFAPDTNINREQMAVIMKNYAAKLGYTVPKTLEAVTFADNASISSWAKEAVKSMQQAGILAGKTNNRFDPATTATRAEVATVLRRFVEIVIDPQTANGWVQNDSGEWSYCKNGEPVKGWLSEDQKWYWLDKSTGKMFSGGWKQIDGKQYYFYADGSMAVNTTVDGKTVGADGARIN